MFLYKNEYSFIEQIFLESSKKISIINPIYHVGVDYQLQFSYSLTLALRAAGILLSEKNAFVYKI